MTHGSRSTHRRLMLESLESRRLLTLIDLTLTVTDLRGAPLPNNQVRVGESFRLNAFARDVREIPAGVFAAYLDVAYDSPSAFSLRVPETQVIDFSDNVTGGSYDVQFGDERVTVPWGLNEEESDQASSLMSAIESIEAIGVGNARVDPVFRDIDDEALEVRFIRDLSGMDIPDLFIDPAGLTTTGGSATVTVSELEFVRSDPSSFEQIVLQGPLFSVSKSAEDGDRDPASGELLDANQFSEVGADLGVFLVPEPAQAKRIWSIELNADEVGVINFEGRPADAEVTLLILVDEPIPPSEIEYGSVTVTVVEGGPPWQNPREPFDVNDDTLVTPVGDVLPLINEANRRTLIDARGRLPIPVTPAAAPPPFYDVNGDDLLTAVQDILPVINFLNRPDNGTGESAAIDWVTAAGPRRPAAHAPNSPPLLEVAVDVFFQARGLG